MSSATLTLLGLYQYAKHHNVDLFENLRVPESIDHDALEDNILLNCGMYELLYPDLEFMLQAISMFSTKYERTFTRWAALMQEEYKPLANYDRIEQWSDSTSLSSSESTSTETSNSSVSSENISAFNSDTMQPNTSAAVGARTAGKYSAKNDADNLAKHEGEVWGNIGVVTTQSIFKEEWKLDKLNIYDEIMKLFAREFLIPFTY